MEKRPLLLLFVLFGLVSLISAMPPNPDEGEGLGKIGTSEFQAIYQAAQANGLDIPSDFDMRSYMASSPSTKQFKILVLLVDFADKPAIVQPAFFDNLVFDNSSPSVKHFYLENSYGKLELTTINLPSSLGWKRLPQTYSYYVNENFVEGRYPRNTQKLTEDLVDLVDPYVDFSQYDNDGNGRVEGLMVIHSGPGYEHTENVNDIWSHKWEISPKFKDGVYIREYSIQPEYWDTPGDMTIGVFAHESGHLFGLPDLYDTDDSSECIGRWSLMASGSWNGVRGSSPAHFDAWSKIKLGFVTPQTISSSGTTVNLLNVEQNPIVYKLWKNNQFGNEYFLIENRQKIGYDVSLPESQPGLLIWHIDESKGGNTQEWYPGNTNNGHYKVALEQADGYFDLEQGYGRGDNGDPWPGYYNKIYFKSTTTPNSKSYSNQDTFVKIEQVSNSNGIINAKIAISQQTCQETSTACTDLLGTKTKHCEGNNIITYSCTSEFGSCQKTSNACANGCYNNACIPIPKKGCYYNQIIKKKICSSSRINARVSDSLDQLRNLSIFAKIALTIILVGLLLLILKFLLKKQVKKKNR